MHYLSRIRRSLPAGLTHLFGSALVAALCATLVFCLWYPSPYSELVGGRQLFLLMISVDIVCGPLLTLVVFDIKKPRRELFLDIGIIVCLQMGALAYGMKTAIEARPVFLAFEKDMFRVVVVPDIDMEKLASAPDHLRRLSLSGPRLIGAKLAKSTDPDFVQSVKASIEGLHPAFRPERWLDYDQQRQDAISKARTLSQLRNKHPNEQAQIDALLEKSQLSDQDAGYLPLAARTHTDWIVIISLANGEPKGFLPLDGW